MSHDLPEAVDEYKKPKTLKDKFFSYIWDSDAHLKTAFERKLIRKLDFGILVVSCLGFFMRYLDAANLANAYVSGMKEDLNILGNEYTYMGTCYTIAYALFQIPGTMAVTRIRPSYFLFMCEVGWGIFTFAQAGAQTSSMMYGFRFCVGMFEAPFFPCILYLMGSWYNKYEMAKRIAIFHLCGSLGSSFGGYLQAAVYETLDGTRGIAGWRWLYIVCGCMTIPCGLAVLLILPDLPSNTRAWYLTEEEKQFALERAIALGRSQPGENKLDWTLVKRMLGTWSMSSPSFAFFDPLIGLEWYGFVLGYVVYGTSCQAGDYFGIWLKSAGYSVAKRNVIPSCSRLLSAFCIFLWGFGSDLTGSRFAFVFGPLAILRSPSKWYFGVLAEVSAVKIVRLYHGGCSVNDCCVLYLANEIMAGDNELRALTISSMNGIQYSVSAWLPIIIFLKPWRRRSFRRGFPATFGFVIAGLIIIVGIKFMADRDEQRSRKVSVLEDGSSLDDKSTPEQDAIVVSSLEKDSTKL
ncbi:major facilitator superfamily domain-containing protein [Mucidula mucida]|nr:major facilitator superfamily domain-containing protein [Mucidula mucida]